jgi:hypothetical protein
MKWRCGKTRNKNRRGKNRAHTKDEKYEREEKGGK